MKRHALTLAAAFATTCTLHPAYAGSGADHPHHGDTAMSQSSQAFERANHRMHEAMAVELTGDTDTDFLRGMVPHHQGAIDMARIELRYGKDPEVRKLAEQIIAAQEQEIATMKRWLSERGAGEAGKN